MHQFEIRPRWRTAAILVIALAAGVAGLGGTQRSRWLPPAAEFPTSADGSNFADLDHFKKSNIFRLGVAWFYPYGSTGSSPVVADGVAYVQGRNNSLVALDATTGKELWIHESLTGMTARGL